MDNRILNINGRRDKGCKQLLPALKLAFSQRSDGCTAVGYFVTKKHGMVLTWYECSHRKDYHDLPTPMSAVEAFRFVKTWLESNPDIEMLDWDADYPHDGHNGPGWRVFVEDWGHVDGESAAICAIKPACMWYGR